ncbi:MAG: hypothetical protein DRO04_00010 [Candidatus Iainarchaeum archaeon]|uniref:Phage portal protein n=1 Tax=Candidatus Iainarchaeum sp. TaxID=3101447 RepID=A0A497JI81_9ARCH|nr:MAG: hypothetical protein DRO04_00010 [Candidatus Diapherotrites archaeon]
MRWIDKLANWLGYEKKRDKVEETEPVNVNPFLSSSYVDYLRNDPTPENKANSVVANEIVAQELTAWRDLQKEVNGWYSVSSLAGELSASMRERIQKQCLFLYSRDAIARNIINSYTFLTIGKGMQVIFADKKARERWEVIAKNVNWNSFYRHTIEMTYLLGEWFVLRIPTVNVKPSAKSVNKRISAVKQKLAKMNPEEIDLIHIHPAEVEEVIPLPEYRHRVKAYKMIDGFGGSREKIELSAFDVTHFALKKPALALRGRPLLEPILMALSMYRLWLQDRVTLNAVRTRIPLIRKVSGGSGVLQSKKDNMSTIGLPRPGTIAIVPKDEEWMFPSLNLSGFEAQQDGRSLLLQICAGVSLPEFLVTGDASNSNYASTIVASSPIIPLIESYRILFGELFADMIEEVVGERPSIQWPGILKQDILELAKAGDLLRANGVISKATYASWMGLVWDGVNGEKAKIDAEMLEDEPIDLAKPTQSEE